MYFDFDIHHETKFCFCRLQLKPINKYVCSIDSCDPSFMSNNSTREVSKFAGRVGFDFGIFLLKLVTRRLQTSQEDSKVDIMSSTGFVTFNDLATGTTVASTPLTHKPNTMAIVTAPEPR